MCTHLFKLNDFGSYPRESADNNVFTHKYIARTINSAQGDSVPRKLEDLRTWQDGKSCALRTSKLSTDNADILQRNQTRCMKFENTDLCFHFKFEMRILAKYLWIKKLLKVSEEPDLKWEGFVFLFFKKKTFCFVFCRTGPLDYLDKQLERVLVCLVLVGVLVRKSKVFVGNSMAVVLGCSQRAKVSSNCWQHHTPDTRLETGV